MILHPIIDLLKRIVIALPDYAGGGGELPESMNHIGSGEVTFASRTILTTPVDLGLDFTPKFVLIWTPNIIGSTELLFGGGVRYLTDNTGSFRYGYCYGTPEDISYYSTDPNLFISNGSLIMQHGSRFYAPTTYYWFAFD